MSTTVGKYFAEKAEKYDDVDSQPYWVFSDELLWHLLQETLLPGKFSEKFRLLDAGAGTGRWSSKILENFSNASAQLVDISEEMLAVAKDKLVFKGLSDRSRVNIHNVLELDQFDADGFDFVISLHNVIGFFDDTARAIANFNQKLNDGGKCAVMFPSFYHAIYFSNATGRTEQFSNIVSNRKVQYNDLMPPLKVFEIKDIKNLCKTAGFRDVKCYGFPLTIYPGMEETFVHGSTDKLVSLFSNESYRKELLELEKSLCLDPALSSRGNNILAVFEK